LTRPWSESAGRPDGVADGPTHRGGAAFAQRAISVALRGHAVSARPAVDWIRLRTTNPIESIFATVRLRTFKSRGCGSRASILSTAFELAQGAEQRRQTLRGSSAPSRSPARRRAGWSLRFRGDAGRELRAQRSDRKRQGRRRRVRGNARRHRAPGAARTGEIACQTQAAVICDTCVSACGGAPPL
jgi:hypothetical protein